MPPAQPRWLGALVLARPCRPATSSSTAQPRWLGALVLAALLLWSPAICAGHGGPPNILLILADDLGYNDLGYNGATEIKTPNIDRLAKEGVVFSNGYAPAPVCSPSRAGLMTGRYPSRFGMEANLAYAPADPHHGLPTGEITLASLLRRAGYRTGLVGKWHLGAAAPFHPLNRGFGSYYGFLGGEHDYFRIDATRYAADEHLAPIGQGRRLTGFTGYLTDWLTDRAIEFASADREQPFFLYLAYNAPHAPLQAPEALLRKYRHVGDDQRRRYLAMVDSLDGNVGRLTAALKASGQWRNTLTFFLSDNGGAQRRSALTMASLLARNLGGLAAALRSSRHWRDAATTYLAETIGPQGWADNAPLRSGKASHHEGGIRVPFLASWPAAWPQGETFAPMVIGLDIAATALAVAGAEADPSRPLDGLNLDPFVRGAASGPPHEALFWRSVWASAPPNARFAVRAGDFKLVRDALQGTAALFNLRDDPGERRDLHRQAPQTAARLASLWNQWNLRNPTDVIPARWRHRQAVDLARSALRDAMRAPAQAAFEFRIGKASLRQQAPATAPPSPVRRAPALVAEQ